MYSRAMRKCRAENRLQSTEYGSIPAYIATAEHKKTRQISLSGFLRALRSRQNVILPLALPVQQPLLRQQQPPLYPLRQQQSL